MHQLREASEDSFRISNSGILFTNKFLKSSNSHGYCRSHALMPEIMCNKESKTKQFYNKRKTSFSFINLIQNLNIIEYKT